MTTPINNFQDIMDAMERDPALRDALRRHILTEELLQVPARLGRIEGDIDTLKEGQERLEQTVSQLGGKVDGLEQTVSQLGEKVDGLEQKFDGLEKKVDRIGGDVSRLTGKDYESHVAAYVHRFLRRGLGMNAAVFSTQSDKSALTRLLDEAESQGLIQPGDTDELDRADLVLTVGGSQDYVLAEVSITVQQDDIDKAARRAGLLATATGRTVTPFAIGAKEEPGLRREHIKVLLIPEPLAI